MKVLIADDDPVSTRLLQRALERAGTDVLCVDNGEAAIELLTAADGPRMAVIDWEMPGRNGPAVCKAVRAATSVPYVYLILLTSREGINDVVAGLEAGADDYLTKPCNPEELKARLRVGHRILQLQDTLTVEAQQDLLTRLPNRAFFIKRLAESVQKAREETGYTFTLLFVDVDRFKLINDSLGHLPGDQLIIGIAERLLQAVRTEASSLAPRCEQRRRNRHLRDVVARLGGDEFVILLDDHAESRDGVRVARRIQRSMEVPFRLSGQAIYATVSIGIATSDGAQTDVTEILRAADAAMYKAKSDGKARYEINRAPGDDSPVNLFRLHNDLRRAVDQCEFTLHYQPIIDLSHGHVPAFEALVRWQHPILGLLPPDAFIPAAEETGTIVPLGAWVLHEACVQMQRWTADGLLAPRTAVCVNISPRQFREANLVKLVRDTLAESGLPAMQLELELTESLTMQDTERSAVVLKSLRDLGLSLSLDDFGTGYSSLSYLLRFPMRTLKIDRAFVSEVEHSRESHEIVQTIIVLGHNLGMKLIAEGVETQAQVDILRSLGCDMAQGSFFSAPLPALDITESATRAKRSMPTLDPIWSRLPRPASALAGSAALPLPGSAPRS